MNQLASMVVKLATGQAVAPEPVEREKDPHAVALGRKGGLKGGVARKTKLPQAPRTEIARKAVQARWAKERKS
jgi:hypothetical protein